MATFVEALREYFVLDQATNAARATSPEERLRAASCHRLAEQRRRAAQLLWAHGHAAEALSLLAAAVRTLTSEDEDAERAALLARCETLPTTDDEVSPSHTALRGELLDAYDRAERALRPRTMNAAAIRSVRFQRALLAATGLGASVGLTWFFTRTPSAAFATASDTYEMNPQFAPENILDGRVETFWLLPNATTGWVEVSVAPPRPVARVRVTNTSNPPYGDRGAEDYRIEAYSGDELVGTIEGRFETPTASASHALPGRAIDRVRVAILSYTGAGGGIADVQLE